MKISRSYMGFTITYSEDRPVTGKWRGVRYGVSVCSGTYESLIRVINQHCNDRLSYRFPWVC